MQAEPFSQIPGWAQVLMTVLGGIGMMIGIIFKYAKGAEAKTPTGDHLVLSATLADGHAVRNLIDEIHDLRTAMLDTADQRHRDSLAQTDATDRLCRATIDNTEAKRSTGITPEMIKLLTQLK